MPQPGEGGEIVFGKKEIDPDAASVYRKKIEDARKGGRVDGLKGSTPVGHVERPPMPMLQRQSRGGPDALPAGLTPEGGVQPRPAGSPVLSPQTQAQLEEIQRQQGAPEAAPEERQEEKKEEDLFETFDFYGRSEAERILNNKKRRKAIEERCQPMSFEDLLMKEEVHQKVPIIPGQFEVEYRSLLPTESLFVKQFMAPDSSKPEAYYVEKYSLCQLTMAVVAINGKPVGTHHLDDNSEVVEAIFAQNLKKFLRKSGYVLADLGINYAWFDVRVRKLFNPDDLGNG